MLTLAQFSFGVGDRFARQAKPQLRAFQLAAQCGAKIVPVWNKSHREHTTVGSQPPSVRAAADKAVHELGWQDPYLDLQKLPSAQEVDRWTAEQYVNALRHDQQAPEFNPHLRQLIHVGYKIAAEMGERYLKMLTECEATIAKNVTANLYERHMRPLFLDVA